MKKLVVCLSLASFSLVSVNALNAARSNYSIVYQVPEKTICIKNAQAGDAAKFFSTTTTFYFEVYKPGTKAEFAAIIDALSATEGVKSCSPGTVTGDYYAINLTLKTAKDKAWFAKICKEAGLGHIKINNTEAIAIEKL